MSNLAFGGNDDVKAAPIWEIAKRSNEMLPKDKTGNGCKPFTRRKATTDGARYFSGC